MRFWQQRLLLQQSTLAPGVHVPPYDWPLQPHAGVAGAALRHAAYLERHLASPLHGPTVDAFAATVEWLDRVNPDGSRALLLDSGCGTGRSTRLTALANPAALVIGVDRSLDRLERGRGGEVALPSNAWLVRAELASFWRLLLEADDGRLAARVRRHLLLYPNPYPKQLGKRWHCHPAFPVALQLGSRGGAALEVRSNWLTYLVELREAVHALAHSPGVPSTVQGAAAAHLPARLSLVRPRDVEESGLTRFEIKYHQNGEPLYRLVLGMGGSDRGGSFVWRAPS